MKNLITLIKVVAVPPLIAAVVWAAGWTVAWTLGVEIGFSTIWEGALMIAATTVVAVGAVLVVAVRTAGDLDEEDD